MVAESLAALLGPGVLCAKLRPERGVVVYPVLWTVCSATSNLKAGEDEDEDEGREMCPVHHICSIIHVAVWNKHEDKIRKDFIMIP